MLHLQTPHLHSTSLTSIKFRFHKRRKLKSHSNLSVSCQSNIFQNIVTVNSLEAIVPALGVVSGLALYLSRLKSNQDQNRNRRLRLPLDWILFTSPTPFNRFVLLRCPSIMFQGSELLEDLNEKLVTEDKHYVKLVGGNVVKDDEDLNCFEYQRTCISTSDGGVISLDWPEKLDLREERGIDTTVVIVPGTPEGSLDKNVRSFVCDSLKRGYFPVVMNPRGCAGSPLTTARLFTAADSDDICTAIQFINKARPWNTMMAVGWGNGANMLTKYLAEVAERTPLTAATCINNPFDLEEATRSPSYHVAVDQKLTSGLINILRSNKELFQGRTKGFDVERALSATSLREFEKEISMISYGFTSIEEFYSKSSTRELVGNVKIPLLFIQTNDGTVPPFSIPRDSIAENAFTSLLMCSCFPPTDHLHEKSVLPWFQHFAIEWLTAVELGLLKGRHPLLKDVDVTVNPSAGLALVESREKNNVNEIVNVMELDALNGYSVDSVERDTTHQKGLASQPVEKREMLEQKGSDEASTSEEEENPEANEKGQALESAELVMNVFDATMPGTLEEEQKKKVLIAVERGETLVKALEGAVSEDVRGKLTAAVSDIVKTQGSNLNLRGIMNVSPALDASSKIQEKVKELSSAPVGDDEGLPVGTDKKEPDSEKPHEEPVLDNLPSQTSEKSLDKGDAQPGNKETNELKQSQDQEANESIVKEEGKIVQGDDMNGMNSKKANDFHVKEEAYKDVSDDQDKASSTTEAAETSLPHQPPPSEEESNHIQKTEDKNIQPKDDQNEQGPSTAEEPGPSAAEASNPSSFNVSQALNALTGFDDSTQVAVNSVFGVIENMIAKLEEENVQQDGEKPNPSKDAELDSTTEESSFVKKNEVVSGNDESGSSPESNQMPDSHPVHNRPDKSAEIHGEDRNDWNKKPPTQSHHTSSEKESGTSSGNSLMNSNDWNKKRPTQSHHTSLEKGSGTSDADNLMNSHDGEDEKRQNTIVSMLSAHARDKVGSIYKVPVSQYVSVNPYGNSLYNGSLRSYNLSKIPNTKSLDMNSTADLLLDYFPDEGQWKLLDKTENGDSDYDSDTETQRSINGRNGAIDSHPQASDTSEIIETSYVILDEGKEQQPVKEYTPEDDFKKEPAEEHETEANLINEPVAEEVQSELFHSAKNIILDSLIIEVGRKLGVSDVKDMDSNLVLDMEHVAEVVSVAVHHESNKLLENDSNLGEVQPLHGEVIVQAISLAVNDSVHLKRVLPVGVIVGSSLAALKKHVSIATHHEDGYNRGTSPDSGSIMERKSKDQTNNTIKSFHKPETGNRNTIMVGAVTAALGASALFASQQNEDSKNSDKNIDITSGPLGQNEHHPQENDLEAVNKKNQSDMVSSFAEKAMSVAAPVMPTKSDGGFDQDRLVAMLSDLGQNGGMLRMFGKLALLWGGIRGAMSLTDRLISFFHIADRPLYQRVIGFACMVLVLWSPVAIPLFPTLVQGWAMHNSSGIAEYACIAGLYTAVVILIVQWGKRIRGYEDPFNQYGLALTSKGKFLDFLKGLVGGIMLVISINSVNVLLGCTHLSRTSGLPASAPHAMELLKAFGSVLILAGQGIATATVVVTVEELLFRSWLLQEIIVDLGYRHAVIISGIAFSIFQRSVPSIPGLLLLSVALSGLKQRNGGSLLVPIGMRAGILSSSFILQKSGALIYNSTHPLWLAGAHPLQPLNGVVGIAFCMSLAMLFYPKQETKRIQRPIRE